MHSVATYHVCWDCREIIISGFPSDYPFLYELTIADVEDEGEETLNVCDVCENEWHSVLYEAKHHKVI